MLLIFCRLHKEKLKNNFMKTFSMIISTLAIATIGIRCNKEESPKTTCNSENGITITNQEGRIYKQTTSEPSFFYIGNVTQVSTGRNGGYIPCSGLPNDFQKEGLIVIYSGVDKGSAPDAGDPLFAFITLSEIKKTK